MQLPEFEQGEFVTLVATGDFKKALQTIFGMGDKPVVYARAFIGALEGVPPIDRQHLLEWCKVPMELHSIGDFKWYLDQIARHEFGHAVAARVLGFKTGEFSLLLKASNGDHVATSLTIPDAPTPAITDVENYLERRIIVLMAGTMSEPSEAKNLESEFFSAWEDDAAESDRQKVIELIQVLLNIRGKAGPGQAARCLRELALKTLQIVRFHHSLIFRSASVLSGRITSFGQTATMTGEEFEGLIGTNKLINPLGEFHAHLTAAVPATK